MLIARSAAKQCATARTALHTALCSGRITALGANVRLIRGGRAGRRYCTLRRRLDILGIAPFDGRMSTPPDTTHQVADIKKQLRKSARETRAAAFARHGAAASDRIAAHGIAFANPPAGGVVTGFGAIGEEINPLPLMTRLMGEGHTLALPVMEAKGKPLLFRAWKPGDPMNEVMWGIHEPLASAPTVEPDVLLVPLLVFDAEGYRLGYGGGFYDRTLARLRAMKRIVAIGIGYDEQRLDAVPHCDYDERLDWVLTPSGPLRCRSEV